MGSAVPCADELEHDQMSWQLTTTLTTGLTLVISKPFYDSHDWEQNLEFSLTGSSTSLVKYHLKTSQLKFCKKDSALWSVNPSFTAI